jgi:hypothetical protein
MPTLAEIRRQYPDYKDLSDKQLLDGLYGAHYADMPRADFNRALGVTSKGRQLSPAGQKLRGASEDFLSAKPVPAFMREGTRAQIARASGPLLGWLPEALGGLAYGTTAVANKALELAHRKPAAALSPQDAYDATSEGVDAALKGYERQHPFTAAANEVAGSFAAPGVGAATRFVEGGKTLVGAAARSGLVGAAYGGAAGAGNAEDGQRLKGAVAGAEAGGVTGLVLPAGVRVAHGAVKAAPQIVRRAAAGGSEAASRVRWAAGRAARPVEVTPEATARAEQIVRDLATRKQVSADAVRADPAVAQGKPITGAEVLGRDAQTQLMALGRRSGATPDILDELLRSRAQGAPARIVEDVAHSTGLDPAAQHGEFVRLAEQMRAEAAPIYDNAYQAGVVSSPKLEDLLRRPLASKAMKRAYAIAKEEGQNPEALGLVNAEVGQDWLSHAPPALDPTVEKVVARAGSSAPRLRQGAPLTKFIADGGGIKGADGELTRMDLEHWHKGKAYQRKLIGDGNTLDGWTEKAWEAGYFPEFQQRPTPRDLLDALDAESRGKPRFAREPDQRAVDRAAMVNQADEMLYRGGNPADAPSPDQYVGRPEPRSEPVFQATPTMRTLDYIKRGMDDVINEYRDPVTRRLNLNTQGLAEQATLKAFRDELVQLNPTYGEALKAGGEPLRLEQAWRDAPKLFSNNIPERVFGERLGKMGHAEKQALLGGLLNDLQERSTSGRLRLKELLTPAFKTKLRAVAGRDAADAFVERVKQEARLAAGGRMAPGANSVTSEVSQAIQEMDRGTGPVAAFTRRLESGQPAWSALPATAAETVSSPLLGLLRGIQAPYNQATRDEVGRILMSPEELAAVLAKSPPSPAGSSVRLSGLISALASPAGSYAGAVAAH